MLVVPNRLSQTRTLDRRALDLRALGRRIVSRMVLAAILGAAGFATLAWSQRTNSPAAEQRLSATDTNTLKQATDAAERGNLQQAQALLQQLRVHHLQNFTINESLGLLYARQGEIEKAVPLLAAAVVEKPGSDVAHANLGTAYFKLRHMHRAARELERAVQLNPENGEAQAALGQTWMLLSQPARAVTAFDAALKVDPRNPDLLYNSALAQFDEGQPAAAAALLARMPGVALSASAQSLYGDTEEKLGHYKQAAEHYATAVQLDPSEANVYSLGLEFLRHWTFGPAIKEFAAGMQNFPGSRRMRLGLAIAYYGNGNYGEAIPVLADLLAADPENTFDAELLGRTCTVLTEGLNPRCASLIKFAELHRNNAVLCTYAAESILHGPSSPAGLTTAHDLLQAAVSADPNLAQAQLETGVLLQMESQWRESIAPLETAVRLQPDSAQAHYRLARAYSHASRKEEAQKQIALYRRYNDKHASDLNSRMKEITTFVVKMQ